MALQEEQRRQKQREAAAAAKAKEKSKSKQRVSAATAVNHMSGSTQQAALALQGLRDRLGPLLRDRPPEGWAGGESGACVIA